VSGRLRVLLVGHGRMGRLVESLAAEHDVEVVGAITRGTAADPASWPRADVAVDFSTAAAVPANARALASRGVALVIGTTGWQSEADDLRHDLEQLRAGVVAAANFAIGVNLFLAIVQRSAELCAERGFAAWIHEAHHAAKKDAPSGTALALQRLVEASAPRVDVSSTRAGYIPGTHTVGFDSPAETITLTHTARDRTAFARGALEAAKWINGRRGWFTMADVLGFESKPQTTNFKRTNLQ
jgi:4-hydroxy-tetrahydrodipicolinate reductase